MTAGTAIDPLITACAGSELRAELVERLERLGWRSARGRSWIVAPPAGPILPGAGLVANAADLLESGELKVDVGGAAVGIRPVGAVLVSELVDGDPEESVGGDALEQVRAAGNGDVTRALSLHGAWTGQLALDPAVPFRRMDPDTAWHVVRDPESFSLMVRETAFWDVSAAIGPDGRPAVVIVLDAGDRRDTALYDAPGLLVVPAAALRTGPEAWRLRIRRLSTTGPSQARSFVAAEAGAVPGLHDSLAQRAAGAALAALANGTAVLPGGSGCELTFQGARQRRLTVPRDGWTAHPDEALALLDWTAEDDAQDRVLAVQQTVAGYDRNELAADGGLAEVRASADTVQRILRSGAVKDAVALLRDTRKAAVDAAKASSEAALAAARSVAERILAGLAATGAVVVAQAATKLPADVARHLVAAVAAYLLFLCAWALLVEGPAVTAPLRAFRQDLPVTADLLGETQREQILQLRSLQLARWRAMTVRVAGPAVYAASSAAVAGLGLEPFSRILHLPLLLP